jgi:hypothetical protein
MTIEKDLAAIKKALLFTLTNERDRNISGVGVSIRNQASEFEDGDKVRARVKKSEDYVKKVYEPVLRGLREGR